MTVLLGRTRHPVGIAIGGARAILAGRHCNLSASNLAQRVRVASPQPRTRARPRLPNVPGFSCVCCKPELGSDPESSSSLEWLSADTDVAPESLGPRTC